MRLSDIVAHVDLDVFASAGLLLFLGSFLLVAFHALRLGRKNSAHFAQIPLEREESEVGS